MTWLLLILASLWWVWADWKIARRDADMMIQLIQEARDRSGT